MKSRVAPISHENNAFILGLIRMRDAPRYVGMDKNRFNAIVRPTLVEIPMGKRGIAFDRVD